MLIVVEYHSVASEFQFNFKSIDHSQRSFDNLKVGLLGLQFLSQLTQEMNSVIGSNDETSHKKERDRFMFRSL